MPATLPISGSSRFLTTGAVNAQRVQVVTPNGSKNRLRISVTGADTSLAAGEYMIVRLASKVFGWLISVWHGGGEKGDCAVWLQGAGRNLCGGVAEWRTNRSYLATFTITAPQANTDTEQVLIIPGDVTGTWLSDTGTGIFLVVGFAAGVTYQGAAGWQAGNVTGTSACSNGIGATGNFELFDIGCYLDPANSGLAPRWQMPDEAEEQQACMRYWWRPEMNLAFVDAAGAHYLGGTIIFPVRMRGVPTLTSAGDGTMTNVGISGVRQCHGAAMSGDCDGDGGGWLRGDRPLGHGQCEVMTMTTPTVFCGSCGAVQLVASQVATEDRRRCFIANTATSHSRSKCCG